MNWMNMIYFMVQLDHILAKQVFPQYLGRLQEQFFNLYPIKKSILVLLY